MAELGAREFRGEISPGEMGTGILAAYRNARRLFEDGVVLLEAGRYPGAVSIVLLAHEEQAKALFLGFICGSSDKTVRRHSWKNFRDHRARSTHTLITYAIAYLKTGTDPTGEFTFDDLAGAAARLRLRSTYVDCVMGDDRWSIPDRLIGKQEAVGILRRILDVLGPRVTPRQIALSASEQDALEPLVGPGKRKALAAWGHSLEAESLGKIDLEEREIWRAAMLKRIQTVEASQP
jgi:AbiV family abortive infection protein